MLAAGVRQVNEKGDTIEGMGKARNPRIYAGLRGPLPEPSQIICEKIRRRSSSPDLDGAEWLGLGCAGGGLGPFAAGHLCGMGASGEQSPLGDGLEARAGQAPNR